MICRIKNTVTGSHKHLFYVVFTLALTFLISACSPALVLERRPEVVEKVLKKRVDHRLKQIQKHPDDIQLLEKSCQDLVKYGYGFLMEKADRRILEDYAAGRAIYREAQGIFSQAIDFGEQALMLKHPQYRSWLADTSLDLEFAPGDVSLLYWTAAAYAGAISASRGNLEWVIQLPRVGYLLAAGLKIDPDWSKGAFYSAMITYTISQPNPPANAEEIARNYFKKAVTASRGLDAGPYLALAESVAKKNQNREEFQRLLNTALAIDINADSELRLNNIIAQKRAQWLLDHMDEFFY